MKLLVNTLFSSFQQLSNILILDMFFILTFSLFGLQMWAGTAHYRCRKTAHPVNGDWPLVEGDTRLCGSFHQCKANTYCGSLYETFLPNEKGVKVQYELSPKVKANLNRDSVIKELNYGITSFDTIGSSYLTVFQCTTLEGWSDIMEMIQDSYSIVTSSLFFLTLVIVCSYFLLNLTVAVMLDNFKRLNKDQTHEFIQKYENNRMRVQQLKDINTILEAKNSSMSSHRKLGQYIKNKCFRIPVKRPCTTGEKSRYGYKIRVISWQIVHIPLFSQFIFLLIILNTLILASDSYPEPEYNLIGETTYYFTALFTIESILKLVGLQFKQFKKDPFNIFDLMIVLASLTELMLSESNTGIISAMRAFRLIRLFKLARSNHTLKCLLDSIAQTIAAIGNFLVLLAIFIYVFALLGMSMFAGSFKFDANGN